METLRLFPFEAPVWQPWSHHKVGKRAQSARITVVLNLVQHSGRQSTGRLPILAHSQTLNQVQGDVRVMVTERAIL